MDGVGAPAAAVVGEAGVDTAGALELRGRLVLLRRFTAADIDARYVGWLNDPEVVRYSNQRFVQHTAESCRRYLDGFDGTSNLFVSIRRLADDQPVGTMTAYRNLHHGTVDVGILVGDRSAWGQGVGQDAWNTMLNWLERQPGLRKITAGTLLRNQGMRRLAERSGMELEAVRRAQELVEGQPCDILLYARFVDA